MDAWGKKMFVTPGVIVDGKAVTHDLVNINLNIRILLGSSYYDDWAEDRNAEPSAAMIRWATRSIRAIRGIKRRCRSRKSATSTAVHLGHVARAGMTNGRRATLPSTPAAAPSPCSGLPLLAGLARYRLHQGHRQQRQNLSAQDGDQTRAEFEWRIPQWSNAIERDRARTYFQAYACAVRITSSIRR